MLQEVQQEFNQKKMQNIITTYYLFLMVIKKNINIINIHTLT